MNNFLNALSNTTYTENGSLAFKSTLNPVYDMFGLAAAYRNRSDADCIQLFSNALQADVTHAMKCLFYTRNIRGGQGERRYFRVCYKWLAKNHRDIALRNMEYIPDFGRWDDLFCLFDTALEAEMLNFIKAQLALDVQEKNPSLLAKWLPSLNASSHETRAMANRIRHFLGWTAKQYRKTLSILRARIRLVETDMSQNHWDEIEFGKLPSKACYKYRKAFLRHEGSAERYEAFATNKDTKVHAGTIYPYECVKEARNCRWNSLETDRAMANKRWESLTDYFNGASFDAIAVVDVSGSMTYGAASVAPIDVAISLGLYCADKARGPFANHFITFSTYPKLVQVRGDNFVDKVNNMERADWGYNTDLESVFNLLLDTAVRTKCSQEDIPNQLIIISDMQIDRSSRGPVDNVIERCRQRWSLAGYAMPRLVYWNVNASRDTFLDNDPYATYISGCSPAILNQLMTGKTGIELMLEVLDSETYSMIG